MTSRKSVIMGRKRACTPQPAALGLSVQPSGRGGVAGLCPGCPDAPVVREETAAAPRACRTWAECRWGAGEVGVGRRVAVAVRRPPGAPLSLRGCPHHVRSPVCGEATPSLALTHAESHLRLWDVNADSFWVQPADSQCTTVAPASAEWPVRKRTALQPVRGSGGIRTTATPWHPCRALHGCISRPSALLKETLSWHPLHRLESRGSEPWLNLPGVVIDREQMGWGPGWVFLRRCLVPLDHAGVSQPFSGCLTSLCRGRVF